MDVLFSMELTPRKSWTSFLLVHSLRIRQVDGTAPVLIHIKALNIPESTILGAA